MKFFILILFFSLSSMFAFSQTNNSYDDSELSEDVIQGVSRTTIILDNKTKVQYRIFCDFDKNSTLIYNHLTNKLIFDFGGSIFSCHLGTAAGGLRFFILNGWDSDLHKSFAVVYNIGGNIVISRNRNYQSIYLSDCGRYFVMQNENYIGICDLNGYEIFPCEFNTINYNGYSASGYNKYNRYVSKTVHNRPTSKQINLLTNSNIYYKNTPWLMMPGPTYSPTFNFPEYIPELNSLPLYGGVGDYISSDSNDIRLDNSSSSTSNTNRSPSTCVYCGGKGRVEASMFITVFGNDESVHCNECNRSFYRSAGHTHISCSHCNGTGQQ